MKKNWLIILITSVLFMSLLLPIALAQPKVEAKELFSVELNTKANKETIGCWKSDMGEFYVFIPTYAELSTAVFRLHTESDVYINGQKITDGKAVSDFVLDQKYDLCFSHYGKKQTANITFMQSQKVATMFIDTETGNMDYIHANKGKGEKGKLRTYFADGTLNSKVDIASLAGRGNNTWDMLGKKPYSLDLSQPTDIFGMGSADRWILLANAADPSNLRNKIAYDFAKEVNLAYSPDCCFVDLYLNGEYAGLYLLCERNEVNKNRLDISQKDGTLVSWEDKAQLEEKNRDYITTKLGKSYRIRYPKTANEELTQKILNKCQTFEDVLFSEEQKDLFKIIDLESFARKYLVDEMLGNLDGYLISHYIYYENADGKLYAGPVWDYDKAIGSDFDKWYNVTNPQAFIVGRNPNNPLDNGYISAFLKNKDFTQKVNELFENEFSHKLNDFLHVKIPQYIKETKAEFEMNKVRWYSDINVGTLQQEADVICNYLTGHDRFLNSVWVEGEEYCKVSITKLNNEMFFAVKKGELLSELPKVENTEWGVFDGFYYLDSNEPFDAEKPINEDTQLYAKWIDSSTNKTDDILKLAPVGIIAVLFVVVFVINIKQIRKSR